MADARTFRKAEMDARFFPAAPADAAFRFRGGFLELKTVDFPPVEGTEWYARQFQKVWLANGALVAGPYEPV